MANGVKSRLGSRLRYIEITPARCILVAAIIFACWRAYNAPFDGEDRDLAVEAINHGVMFANMLLNGQKDVLMHFAVEPATERLKKEVSRTSWTCRSDPK